MGRLLATLVLLVVIVFGLAWAFGFVNLKQTRDATLPSVNVSGGQSPKFDVSVANVTMGTKNESVTVPTIGTKEKQVEVPTVNVDKPAKSRSDPG